MFGTNEIVGKSRFKEELQEPGWALKVTSMFYTIQGEGPFAGMPAVFLRLAHCNLNCSFCDTYFDDGEILQHKELIDKLTELVGDKTGLVLVITGGEPLLQASALSGLWRLYSRQLNDLFIAIQVETNGVLSCVDIPSRWMIVCSPKVNEKTGKYLTPHTSIFASIKYGHSIYFKFVVSADEDSPYHQLPKIVDKVPVRRTYITPMNVYNREPQAVLEAKARGENPLAMEKEQISFWEEGLLNREVNQRNHQYAAKLCLEHGYVLSLQMHIYANLP